MTWFFHRILTTNLSYLSFSIRYYYGDNHRPGRSFFALKYAVDRKTTQVPAYIYVDVDVVVSEAIKYYISVIISTNFQHIVFLFFLQFSMLRAMMCMCLCVLIMQYKFSFKKFINHLKKTQNGNLKIARKWWKLFNKSSIMRMLSFLCNVCLCDKQFAERERERKKTQNIFSSLIPKIYVPIYLLCDRVRQ
jgi:hypothetical protein